MAQTGVESKKALTAEEKKGSEKPATTLIGTWYEYSQTTGDLNRIRIESTGDQVTTARTLVGTGYAGGDQGRHPEDTNNANSQGSANRGPIPRGVYEIGSADNHTNHPAHNHMGPNHMPLTPTSYTNTEGRNGFYIHADNSRRNQSASQGCVVLGPSIRAEVARSGIRLLTVVE